MIREWYKAFRGVILQGKYALPLRETALEKRRGEWTALLTKAVADTCRSFGWVVTAKGETDETLPVKREEYLGLDVIVFEGKSLGWQLPVAIFELENRRDIELVSYSLWKVNAIRCRLRGVFCYREVSEEIPSFIRELRDSTMLSLDPDRTPLLLVVGTRGKAESFPNGFFQPWYWDHEWKSFRKLI